MKKNKNIRKVKRKNINILDNDKVIMILRISGIIISILVIVFAFLQLFNVCERGDYIFIPGIGVLMIIQALENWNKNWEQAKYSLGIGVFIFVVFISNTIVHLIRG